VSYTDSDYYNNGDGGYNDGWAYRNDGVDIEQNNNPNGHPYNIGWTETGEWLGYTIESVQTGTYDLKISVSAQNSGGMFFAQLNGQNVGVINVPSTGGWYNWEDVLLPSVEISENEIFLRIQIVQPGFNIESIKFEQVTASTEPQSIVNDFSIGKAYPNPFNNNIEIPIQIDKPNIYVAEIFNINGHSIIKLFNEMIDPGPHSITWGGKNKYGNGVPSGTYFLVVSNGEISNKQKILLLK